MTSERAYDPRDTLTHEIQAGQLYGHARSKTDDGEYAETSRLMYADDEKVLLRSNRDFVNHDRPVYYNVDRETFEKRAGEEHYKLLEDTDSPVPKPTDGILEALTVAKRHRDRHHHQVECGGSRIDKHKREAIDALIEDLETLTPQEVDWTEVAGVGEHTAGALRAAGFETDARVLAASDDELLAVEGVGEGTLQKIREEVV